MMPRMYSLNPDKDMSSAKQHSPVILLLGERSSAQDSVEVWLAESRYSALEAADVFHVLEAVSDFTLRNRPDVIFLHVDRVATDLEFMQTLVGTAVGEPDVPIIDFAGEPRSQNEEGFDKAIAGLVCRLDEFIPMQSAAKA